MKFAMTIFLILISLQSMAQSRCDIRPGVSLGIPVVEFTNGHSIYSKIPLAESTPAAIAEEMLNLQDMELCSEQVVSQKCVLRFEKTNKTHVLTFFRGEAKWKSWTSQEKREAQEYVLRLKRAGFCS